MVYLVWLPILNSEFLRITLIVYSKMEFWLVKSTKVFQRNQKICDLLSSGSADCERLFSFGWFRWKEYFPSLVWKGGFCRMRTGGNRDLMWAKCALPRSIFHTKLTPNYSSTRFLTEKSAKFWYSEVVTIGTQNLSNFPAATICCQRIQALTQHLCKRF